MFANLLGASPVGAAGKVAGLASGGPSSAESGSGTFNLGGFQTGDTVKGKSKAEIYTDTIIKVGAVIGAVVTITTFLKNK